MYSPGLVPSGILEDSHILTSYKLQKLVLSWICVPLPHQSFLLFYRHLKSPYLVSTYRDSLNYNFRNRLSWLFKTIHHQRYVFVSVFFCKSFYSCKVPLDAGMIIGYINDFVLYLCCVYFIVIALSGQKQPILFRLIPV